MDQVILGEKEELQQVIMQSHLKGSSYTVSTLCESFMESHIHQ